MQKFFLFTVLLFPLFAICQIADSTKREVKLQGAINFRDIGGYKTKDGKTVQWGKIYRSAEINRLTAEDLDKLERLNIHYVLDFRGPSEVAAGPDKVPNNAIRISLPAGSEEVGDRSKMFKQMSTAVVDEVIGVKAAYIKATFQAIVNKYGSVDKFLKTEMGLNKSALRKLKKKYLI
ncbi:MAG: tyrosine-protein phosphatase [Chitinophagaceae bacterium]|nr:tyrosine-protein phosphatase [Chitinophagaceae bacterium]